AARTGRTPRRPMANRSEKTRSGWSRRITAGTPTPSSSSLTRRGSCSAGRSRPARRSPRRGTRRLPRTRGRFRTWHRSSGAGRLASLSGLHVIYVWTHDSVGLGEDGPTHQPVEHYAALRAIPNLWFVRPGDANEAAAAWALALERGGEDPSGPVALSLTRQKLPTLAGTA